MSWREVGDGVLVRRYGELDLSVGLVLGADSALVVDTRGDRAQGAELAAAVRGVTALPWQVVLTHGHFDHCFGTEAFRPAPIWAHPGCRDHLRAHAERQRTEWIAHYRGEGRHDIAEALAGTEVVAPDHPAEHASLDLGGREVVLHHPGPGHTDHDLVVAVPDAGVLFAGDLVEQGADPDFEDAVPQRWPAALDELLRLRPEVVVPGHGDPVDAAFVRRQRDDLARLAELCEAVRRGELGAEAAVAESPFGAAATAQALRRAGVH